MEAIVLLGAPGAGKGTAARGLEACTSYRHLSTGDLFRRIMHEDTGIGRAVRPYMEQAKMVPDELVLFAVGDRLRSGAIGERVLFDGFPRTLMQGEALDRILEETASRLRAVFLLEAGRDVLVERMSGRMICPRCGRTYHDLRRPPGTAGQCDDCTDRLLRRNDDRGASIGNRLAVYEERTAPLVKYYRDAGILKSVDAGMDAAAVVRQIVSGLNGTG